MGVGVFSSNIAMTSSLIRDTAASPHGQFGDGLSVFSPPPHELATVHLSSVRIESSQRAGVSNFGGTIDFADTVLQCSAFDIEGEPAGERPFVFNDLGGNVCGCPEAKDACEVLSVNLEPPEPQPSSGL